MLVAVLGLGEAGTIYAGHLVSLGAEVRGFDIRRVQAPEGVTVTSTTGEAVVGADLVLSLTTAAGALEAARAAAPYLCAECVYADLNASSPSQKIEVSGQINIGLYADVAVLAPAQRQGIQTPVLVSGPGSLKFIDLLSPYGAHIEHIPGPPGTAASRKLLRSVFMKCLATSVLEALIAARAVGCEDWVRAQIVSELNSGGAALVERLESGTYRHAERRFHEMEDTDAYVRELGKHTEMVRASISWLDAIRKGER